MMFDKKLLYSQINDQNLLNFLFKINKNLGMLYDKQDKLDNFINEKKIIKNRSLNKLILAFLVELAELANENRCFKYWSHKKSSKKDIILEEYSDGLHFLLAIGLDVKQNYHLDLNVDEKVFNDCESDLTKLFINLFTLFGNFSSVLTNSNISNNNKATKLNYNNLKKQHNVLFLCYLYLGYKLNFSALDIVLGYESKYKINWERQQNNY